MSRFSLAKPSTWALRRKAVLLSQINSIWSKSWREFLEGILSRALMIVTFRDPNDQLSYALTPQYADQRMDSRLCLEIPNVILNVAKVLNVLGIGELANSMKAHNGYQN